MALSVAIILSLRAQGIFVASLRAVLNLPDSMDISLSGDTQLPKSMPLKIHAPQTVLHNVRAPISCFWLGTITLTLQILVIHSGKAHF